MSVDAFALLLALMLAFVLRFDNLTLAEVTRQYIKPHLTSIAVAIPLYLLIFRLFRLYRHAWRFASLEVLWGTFFANTSGLAMLIVMQTILEGHTFPRSVLAFFWMLSLLLVGGIRILLRIANLGRNYGFFAFHLFRRDVNLKRVVILGAGPDSAHILTLLQEDPQQNYGVIGFLDDAPDKQGIYIRGVRIIGQLRYLYDLLAKHAVDEVLIAIPDADGTQIRDFVMACRRRQVSVKVIPQLQAAFEKSPAIRLEEISVEDLLRRPPVRNNLAELGKYLTGKRVLVTGAGGSIGSELCRQIMTLNPSTLILVGHGENSIHRIQQELLANHPSWATRLHLAIGSISDSVRMDQIFQAYQPQIVFHAAAHKHVPIMEMNVPEAVQNNVLGTRHVAECCGRHRVERMVAISTDKAVYPSSVMGATKWLCEEIVRGYAKAYPDTTYVTVRFGNVLGSRGSVVPIFKEQIKRGGPVTVTDPHMTRFFMTIPEAVQLVLASGAIGITGKLYLLDMGEPVRILDLAHDMIRLSGFEPEKDITIHFTGLRPGEKLHELLTTEDESIESAPCRGLHLVQRPGYFDIPEMQDIVRRLQQLAGTGEVEQLLELLAEVVPSFADYRQPLETLNLSDDTSLISHA
jgi:FlaA1/EpsC-like NDP-sugar epimerase